MKDKTCSIECLELYNKGVVIPTGERLQVLRGDQGTEVTKADYRKFCLDLGITLQFAAPSTPQQIGANERAGQTIVNIVRCLLADSGLPKFLWGELMQTAVYLSNRSPHAALNNGTPYKALYGKDAYLGHLRVVGARAFVHQETYTKKLEHRAWEGRLVGYSMDSKAYRIYNAETRRVRESRNVIFLETPYIVPPPSPDVGGYDDSAFTHDSHDDMVRDVRNYTFNQSLDSHPPSHAVGGQAVTVLLDHIRRVTDQDLGLHPAGSSPNADSGPGPMGSQPGGDGLPRLGE